jgi:hypothetical protein
VLLLAATLAWAAARPALRQDAVAAAPAADARWQPWSTERVAEALAQGRPVFVDFTAAWCVTCQFNKRTTLGDESLIADFDARACCCCAPTGRAATPPSPPSWRGWAATACRCMRCMPLRRRSRGS